MNLKITAHINSPFKLRQLSCPLPELPDIPKKKKKKTLVLHHYSDGIGKKIGEVSEIHQGQEKSALEKMGISIAKHQSLRYIF